MLGVRYCWVGQMAAWEVELAGSRCGNFEAGFCRFDDLFHSLFRF